MIQLLITLAILAVTIVPTVLGLILAFSANFLLGFVVLVIEPLPWVIGIVYMFTGGGTNLAVKLLALLS